jgi:hypothetical protein
MTEVHSILNRKQQADSIRLANSSIWRDIAPYVHPTKRDIGNGSTTPDGIISMSSHAALFDSCGIEANRVYAAGSMAGMTPSDSPWFALEAPNHLKDDDEIKAWYSRCTDITLRILADSNFYNEKHNVELDDGAFGTAGLYIQEDFRDGVRFESLPIGDYSILENHYREVDTVFQTDNFTARQAAQKFGEKNLPHEILKCLEDPKKVDSKHEFIRVILPRTDRSITAPGQANMPYACLWIEPKSKKVISDEGFEEAPFAVSRHTTWNRSPYGISPGMLALYDLRQLNVMQEYLDTLVEKMVTPPVIAPPNYEGVIDLRGGGITYGSPDGNPQHWENSPSNYSVGDDRTSFRKRQVDKAFYVDLFQVLSSVPVGKEMTAEEIRTRRRDQLPLFAPAFSRKNKEMNGPIIKRVFNILFRGGAYPTVPDKLVFQSEAGPYIPDPQITYTGRIALEMREIHNEGALRALEMAQAIAQTNPEILDNIDMDEVWRSYARNVGMNEDSLRSQRDRDALRQARQEMEEQQRQEISQLEEAEAVAKLAPAINQK